MKSRKVQYSMPGWSPQRKKVEHYKIAAYGSLCAPGKQLGLDEGVKLLMETLEEKATGLKLTEFTERAGNEKASQGRGSEQAAREKVEQEK